MALNHRQIGQPLTTGSPGLRLDPTPGSERAVGLARAGRARTVCTGGAASVVRSSGMPAPIPTHHARQGRVSALTRARLENLLPRHTVSSLPVEPRTAFGRVSRFVIEIGSGHGDSAAAYARSHPGSDVLAIEVHRNGVARLLAAADEQELTNLWVEASDAVAFVSGHTTSATVDEFHVFFPDPWPKARHAKRRLLCADALDLWRDRLRTGGLIRFATDHPSLLRHTLAEVERHGGFAARAVARPWWRPAAGFEDRGGAEGRQSVYLELVPLS